MNIAKFLLIAAAIFQSGDALSCYSCKPTSMTTACADPLTTTSNDVHTVTCPTFPPNFLCLKVVGKFTNGTTGVMRDCVLDSVIDVQCRTFGNIMGTLSSCSTCSKDLCNDALPTVARTTFIFLAALSLIWLSRR